MTCQEIHKYIWQSVIDDFDPEGFDEDYVVTIKHAAVEYLRDKGRITQEQAELLHKNSDCVCCTLYRDCEDCVLPICSKPDSLYKKVCQDGDAEAMEKIRDTNVLGGYDIIGEHQEVLESDVPGNS